MCNKHTYRYKRRETLRTQFQHHDSKEKQKWKTLLEIKL